jgi:hypothetical protein
MARERAQYAGHSRVGAHGCIHQRHRARHHERSGAGVQATAGPWWKQQGSIQSTALDPVQNQRYCTRTDVTRIIPQVRKLEGADSSAYSRVCTTFLGFTEVLLPRFEGMLRRDNPSPADLQYVWSEAFVNAAFVTYRSPTLQRTIPKSPAVPSGNDMTPHPHTKSRGWSTAGIMALLTLLLSVGAAHTLAAQSMPCDTAAAALRRPDGVPYIKLATAASRIVRCGDLAPPAIMAAFRASGDKSQLDSLANYAAWELADERLADSIGVIAKDPSFVSGKRLSALRLLVRYVSPTSIQTNITRREAPFVLGLVSDANPILGNQPITAAGRARALNIIKWMGVNEPNGEVRRTAKIAGENLDMLISKGG